MLQNCHKKPVLRKPSCMMPTYGVMITPQSVMMNMQFPYPVDLLHFCTVNRGHKRIYTRWA
uniref:Uncharacterized protein n=1 Tax=Siphoviridae sp. ctPEx3 TaxID=2823578 RepID=A0A8S5LFS6_9CAUD|nr:MAG TPA: hypothetical protein [Siphoviridae sp. ctPEx3]